MIKLFITDLDGTLLEEGTTIIPENKKAIEALKAQQITFGIATGRMDRDIVEMMNRLGEPGHRISQNGAFVFHKDNSPLHAKTFSNSIAKQLYQTITEIGANVTVGISTATEGYLEKIPEEFKQLEHLLLFPIVEEPKILEKIGETIFPSKISLHGETSELLQVKQQVDASFHTITESFLSDAHCVDFVPLGISKGESVKNLLEHLQLQPEEVAVIGDSFNDVSMFDVTPHSFAMATAHPDVQARASYVVSHVHEAVDQIMKKASI